MDLGDSYQEVGLGAGIGLRNKLAWRPGDGRVVTIRSWGKCFPRAHPSIGKYLLVFAKNASLSLTFGEAFLAKTSG